MPQPLVSFLRWSQRASARTENPDSGIASSLLYKVQPRTREALMEAVGQAISAVSARDAESFLEHCEYRTPVRLLRRSL